MATCGICGGPNDIGELCAGCAREHRDVTLAAALELDGPGWEEIEQYKRDDLEYEARRDAWEGRAQ